MRIWLVWWLSVMSVLGAAPGDVPGTAPVASAAGAARKVVILPVRDPIMPPLLYVIRRGVKQAIDQEASLIVLDMNTPGGRLDTTREIFDILAQFKGEIVTFVNKDAFSAGAFIAVATKKIYMAPESVIGAAAPIMVDPSGGGAQELPDTYEKKMTSAVRAMVRATAEKNGYNVAVVEAMIDKSRGLTIDGKVIAKEGEILTLTNTEAEKEYGTPPTRLLSSGTVADLDALLELLGHKGSTRVRIEPTGLEKVGSWLNAISPLLLMIGVLGLYIEFKTPGFGLPGIVGISAFVLYFLGGYAAGLSGFEWVVVFLIGLALVAVELFVYPGTLVLGLSGAALILAALVMAMVDLYPNPGPGPGLPRLPSFDAFQLPFQQMALAMLGAGVGIWILSRYLPRTTLYQNVVSTSVSGGQTDARQEERRSAGLGREGVTVSVLRPGGKARFGDELIDVMAQGEMVPKGARVRIVGYSGTEAMVEVVPDGSGAAGNGAGSGSAS